MAESPSTKSAERRIAGLFLPSRNGLKEKKPYRTTTFGSIPDFVNVHKLDFRTGEKGLYLGVYPYKGPEPYFFEAGFRWYTVEEWIWPMYDIDGRHKSIASAIERSHEVYGFLEKENLAQYTKWLLSGTGFRCIFNFLIPSALRDGWIEHLKKLKRFGVDASPFLSKNSGGIPIRLLCYRGNVRQCQDETKSLDRHSVLVKNKSLFTLSENQYLDLTRGRPDLQEYVAWSKEILPKQIYDLENDLPPEVSLFFERLDQHATEHRIRQNIRTGSPFLKKQKVSIEKILAHLESQGIEYEEDESLQIWRLSRCPSCGQIDHAWLLESGRLRCFAATCAASRAEGGLSLRGWLEGEVIEGEEGGVCAHEIETVTLHEAERLASEHFLRDGNLALAVTPGVGKTHRGIEKAMSLAQFETVVYAMPQHDLIEEWVEKVKKIDPSVPVTHITGRSKGKCKKELLAQHAYKRGYYPSQTICFKCEWHPSKGLGSCTYYRQFLNIMESKKGLIFCATHQLPYLIHNSQLGKIGTIFIDEQALTAMVHKEEVSSDFLSVKFHLTPRAVSILDTMMKTAEQLYRKLVMESGEPVGKLYTAQPEGTWWADKKQLWELSGIKKEEARAVLGKQVEDLLSKKQSDLFDLSIDRTQLLWIQAALSDEPVAWIAVRKDPSRPITCHFIHKLSIPRNMKIIVLDASTSQKELSALFGRNFDLLQLNVPWEGRRIHIQCAMGQQKKTRITDSQFARYAALIKEEVSEGNRKWLLCTHKRDEDETLRRLGEEIPEVSWEQSHFFADRGRNRFEGVDGVFCYGLPIWNPDEMYERAALLFPGDAEQQIRWVEEQNLSEIYQKVHRARFVRNPGKTLIVMGHFWPPILGEPDRIIDLTRSGAPLNAAMDWASGIFEAIRFFDRQIAALSGVAIKERAPFSLTDKLQNDFEKIIQRVEDMEGVYPLLYKIFLLGVGTPSRTRRIMLPKRNTWGKLLSGIQDQMGGGRFEIKLSSWGNTWSHAVGSVSSARAFYGELRRASIETGIPFSLPEDADIREVSDKLKGN